MRLITCWYVRFRYLMSEPSGQASLTWSSICHSASLVQCRAFEGLILHLCDDPGIREAPWWNDGPSARLTLIHSVGTPDAGWYWYIHSDPCDCGVGDLPPQHTTCGDVYHVLGAATGLKVRATNQLITTRFNQGCYSVHREWGQDRYEQMCRDRYMAVPESRDDVLQVFRNRAAYRWSF